MNRFLELETTIIKKTKTTLVQKKTVGKSLTWRRSSRSLSTTPDWCRIKHNIIRICTEEEEDVWTMPDGITKRKENEAEMLPELQKYWRDGVQSGSWQADAIASQSNKAWSAAFVCWVMREAGVLPAHGFQFAGRHMNYIVGALRNREGEAAGMANFSNKAFWLYDINEQNTVKVEVGDILCMNRSVNGNLTTHSYQSLKRSFFDNGKHTVSQTFGASHCDIVVAREGSSGSKHLYAVGGNKAIPGQGNRGWTVNSIQVPVDNTGIITNPATHRIFAFIKFRKCTDFETQNT